MSVELTDWIASLEREKLESIVYELTDRLMEYDEIRFNPEDEDLPNAPYWISCGIELGEDE